MRLPCPYCEELEEIESDIELESILECSHCRELLVFTGEESNGLIFYFLEETD